MNDSGILPNDTRIGAVTIRTANLEVLRDFYTKIIGMEILASDSNSTKLGIKSDESVTHLLTLKYDPSAAQSAQPAPGLFHFAILLPHRRQLGQFLIHTSSSNYPLDGASDHLVSEALYLQDPDGNGIEVYRDRPNSEWKYDQNGNIRMVSDPLQIESLIHEAERSEDEWTGLPPGTKLGHMHLQVSNLQRSVSFYNNVVGLDITNGSYPGANFLSAGGYHHHIGLNTWHTANSKQADSNASGLANWELIVPDPDKYDSLLARLGAANSLESDGDYIVAVDPDSIKMTIKTE